MGSRAPSRRIGPGATPATAPPGRAPSPPAAAAVAPAPAAPVRPARALAPLEARAEDRREVDRLEVERRERVREDADLVERRQPRVDHDELVPAEPAEPPSRRRSRASRRTGRSARRSPAGSRASRAPRESRGESRTRRLSPVRPERRESPARLHVASGPRTLVPGVDLRRMPAPVDARLASRLGIDDPCGEPYFRWDSHTAHDERALAQPAAPDRQRHNHQRSVRDPPEPRQRWNG